MARRGRHELTVGDEMDIDGRDAWELDPAVAHLNHGSFGAVPRVVLAEQRRWIDVVERNPTAFHWRRLDTEMDTVRHQVAAFVGTAARRCLLLPNVTSAIGLVLASVPLVAGDEVIVTDDTYPGVRAAAEVACSRAGARLVIAALPPDDLSSAAIERAVLGCAGPRTRLAIVDHVTSATAVLVDVAALTGALRARGVRVAIDGAHAPGSVTINLDSIGADYYAGNFHKWCCAPRGSAFLAVHDDAMAGLVPAVVGSRMVEGFPTGFEWRGTTDCSAILATPAALHFFEALGWEAVQAHNRAMANRGAAIVAAALRTEPPPSTRLPMAVVPLAGMSGTSAVIRLRDEVAARGVEVAIAVCRGQAYVRMSSHLYNGIADFVRLADALRQLLPRDEA